MTLHVLLATVGSVPVLDHVNRALLALPESHAQKVLVAYVDEIDERVTKALAGLTLVRPFEEEVADDEPVSDADLDLQAMARAWTVLLEGAPFETEEKYPTVVARIVESTDLADVRARLEKKKLSVLEASELSRPPRLTETEASKRALAPFDEHYPDHKGAVEAFLRGKGPAPLDALRSAPKDYYDEPSAFLSDSLTGAIERWNEKIASKVLELWAALLGANPSKGLDVSLGLGEDDLPPELGLDRARAFYEAAVAHGLADVHAAVAARSVRSPSNWFLAPSFLARPEVFAEGAKIDLVAARALAAQAVPKMWLDHSPTAKRKLAELVKTGSPALGAEALLAALDLVPELVEERHVPTDDDVYKSAELAAKLDPRIPGTLARTTERWMKAATPKAFVEHAAHLLSRDPEHVDKAAAWDRLLECIEASPADPFGGDAYSGPTVLEALTRPDAKVKARVAKLLADHGATLGLYYRKRFEKIVGKKPAPLPYDSKDLEGLESGLQKAIEGARAKSHAEGIKLPKGLSEKAIAKQEKLLGSALPPELRAFYAVHDGAGDDECFNGQRLFGLEEAVRTRQTLLEGDGKPFDVELLPITSDGAGNHACIVLHSKGAGEIVDFDHETGRGRRLAKSFSALLKSASWAS